MLSYKKTHYFFLKQHKALILFTLFFLLYLSGCSNNSIQKAPPKALNGILELSQWNPKQDGSIQLKGEWDFYWKELLTPTNINIPDVSGKKSTILVPSTWKGYNYNGNILSDDGYATYRLILKLDEPYENLALNTTAFISACKIWVDNEEVYNAGKVSDSKNTALGCFKPHLLPLNPKGNEFQIIVQISNFGYAYGGFVTCLELGDINMLIERENKQSYIDIFLFGSILIMSLYHFTLYLLRKKDHSTLYFGVLCLLIAIRVLLMGNMLLYKFLSFIPLFILLKLSMLTLSFAVIFFVMFIKTVFPKYTPKWLIYFTQISCLSYSLINISVSDKFNNLLIVPFEIIALFILAILIKIIVIAAINKAESSFLVLVATISIIVFSINDILNSYGVISIGYYIPLGLFLFIFIQSFMLSKKFANSFTKVEELSHKLIFLDKLKDEYLTTYKKLKTQENQLLKSELRMLQAQIKPHFLFNALNTIISVCRVSSDKAEELLLNLSNYLRCGFSFKNDDEFVDLETELLHVKSYLAIEKERFKDKLNIIFDIDDSITCKIPAFIIQPIVENAVRHGILPLKNGGTVKLIIQRGENFLNIIVEDNGLGIAEDTLALILNDSYDKAGIGLKNVKSRIKRIYGESVEIKSTTGSGTTIIIKIPLEKEVSKCG